MSLQVKIEDGQGSGDLAHVHNIGIGSEHVGLLTLQERFLKFNPLVRPFLNDSFGTAMNQNVTFSGTPEIIHNGGTSTEWTGSALAGTWNFADSGKVSLASGNNNDAATFAEETPTTIDMSGFTTLTGKINLTAYDPTFNSLDVIFDLSAVNVGNSVDINDFIDTGLIGTEQAFIIPKADLGLTTQGVDGFTITCDRSGGTKPTMTFDDIQLEQTGDSAVFLVSAARGSKFHITEIRIGIADALAGTLADGTMPGLSYDKILALSALTNGIVFSRVQENVTNFSVTFKQIGDFLSAGSNLINQISDGTNTFITFLVTFPEPIILEGDPTENFLSFTINDNLSGLLQFTASARGAVEV